MADAPGILAKHFDSRLWRAAEKAAALPSSLYRQVQGRHPELVQRWDPAAQSASIPAEARLACLGVTDGLSSVQKLLAFRHALAAGAHGVADALVESVVEEPGAIAALYRHWIAIGDETRAADWREKHAARLAYTGRLDSLQLVKAIDDGELDADALAKLLVRHRGELLGNSELHLLAHRSLLASDPIAARDAWNRYLRAQGSACVTSASTALGELAFAKVVAVNHGPRVSVLISAYNAEATIDYALGSVLDQSYRNIEVLVCDDGSSDDTLAVAQKRASSDPRLRLFRSNANQGSYNVRNALISEAAGDLITVHDADDISLPRRIELQVAQLRDVRKKASVTNFLRVTPEGQAVFFHDRKACRMAIVSLMASRETFAAIGPYRNAKFGADFEFLEKLKDSFGAGSVARIRSPQLFCLWSTSSVTRSAASEALATGYRSPARRAYSDYVYRQRILGGELEVPEEMQSILVAPSGIAAVK